MILRQFEWNAANLRVIALALALGSFCAPAVAAPEFALSLEVAPVGASDTSPTPDACYIIFPSEELAALHCPAGVKAVVAYDFWKNQPLGWSCDCAHPTTASEDSLLPGPALR